MEKILNGLICFLRRLGTEGLFRSLRAKIILGVSLILVLVIGSFTYYEAVTRIKSHLKNQEERAFDISAAVMKGIEYPMLDGEMDDVQAILERLGMLEGLEVVKLCDLMGTIRYSRNPDNIGKASESGITRNALRNKALAKGLELHRGKKLFSHSIPIYNERPCFKCHGSEKDILGVLTVGINWGPIEKRIRALRNREIAVAVISLAIVAFFLIRWLSKNITQPIFKVTEFANEVSRGKLNATLDLGKRTKSWERDKAHGGDEIVQLSDSLMHMLRNMREMYGKISSFSKDLELQVAKRTEELEQKTAELEQANIELKKLDELRSTFLANMSHELRTPLNSIIGYTDLLIDRVDGNINEEQEKSLTKVHKNAKNLLKLINDVLDMSRIESGRVELDLRAVNLQEIIQETASALEPLINNKGLIIDMDFDESLPLGYADPDRIRQVVTNLLDNAIKFTAEGRITVSARPSEIGTKGNQPPRFVEVCISDTGIGIRKEDLNKLFDKFRPLDISATSEYRGAGLGLSICKGLVEMQNGSIWAESKYGEGSRFCFALPVEAEAIEPKRKSLQQDYQAMGVLKEDKGVEKAVQIKVLVVDDEPDHVELISKILREEGYQITKAYDGEGAIESIKHSKPDLIILDLMMPNVSGFDVIEYLKTGDDTKEIPIIVVTGKELTREQMEVLDGRVEKILKKGLLGVEVILEVVRNTLDKFGLC